MPPKQNINNDSEKEVEIEQELESTTGNEPSAETKNTEHMIPKSRFDEVNKKFRDLESQFQSMLEKQEAEAENRLAEQEKWKELADKRATELAELKKKASQLEGYQSALEEVLKAQMEDIPEELQSLIPDELTVEQRLNWIARNKKLLVKPIAPENIGQGKNGGNDPSQAVKLSPEEIKVAQSYGMTAEEYAKFKKG